MLNETPTLAPDGLPYRLLTLRNSAGMVVTVMDWGGNPSFCPRTDAGRQRARDSARLRLA